MKGSQSESLVMENSVSTNKKCRTKVDRISDLPDSLLLHILSFLSAKEAVATSLLSKRWRSLWLSLPTLNLNREDFQDLESFEEFVDEMLDLVDLKSVKKFVLRCDHYGSHEYFIPMEITEWIYAVISNKVEHLELYMRLQYPYELPSRVLIDNNIRVLKLREVMVRARTHVNLPLLEVLHLEHFEFPPFRCLEILLSSCPLLKDLVLKFWDVDNYCPLNIARLDHLVTANVPQSLIPLEVLSNVTFLRLYKPQFSCMQDKLPFTDDMPMFSNLTHLEFDIAGEWTETENCFRSFPKLQKLVFSRCPISKDCESSSVYGQLTGSSQ